MKDFEPNPMFEGWDKLDLMKRQDIHVKKHPQSPMETEDSTPDKIIRRDADEDDYKDQYKEDEEV